MIPVGTYLSDAAKRFGVLFEEKCMPAENLHFCKISVLEGENALTRPTAIESEFFSQNPGDASERLACQTKILEPDEIVIMTAKKKEETTDKDEQKAAAEAYAKEFKDLPLEKKIADLVQLEAVTLSETLSFIVNSPYLVFDKVMDVMAEFGMKKEEQGKKAARPAEHADKGDAEKKSTGSKKTPPKDDASQQTASAE